MLRKYRSASAAVLTGTPFAALALVVIADVSAGPGVGLLPLVSLGPAFASLSGGWRRAASVGALALVLCAALGWYNDLLDEDRGQTALVSVTGVTAAAVGVAVTRQRRQSELDDVRSVAEVAQRVLVRPPPAELGPLRIAVSYRSAAAPARIGGDLYDVVDSPRGTRVIIGDVQGRGLEAVESAATVLGVFRACAPEEPDLETLGHRLQRAADRELGGEKFVTAIVVEVTPELGVTFINYGHPAPMLVRRDGTVRFPAPRTRALPLGLGAHETAAPRPYGIDLLSGDRLLLYTDGVTEARNSAGAFYPLEDHAHLLTAPDPADALRALRADVDRHVDGDHRDDSALLLLHAR